MVNKKSSDKVQGLGDGHRKRLRDRFFHSGISAFAPHELVELLLMLAIPRRDVKPLAKAMIARFGSLRAIVDAESEDLLAVKGVTEITVFALKFMRSLIPLYLQSPLTQSSLTNTPQLLEQLWRSRLGHENQEVFEIAHFDAGLRLLQDGIITHSRGSQDQSAVFPGEVIKQALKLNAFAIAFAHNHPSGDPTPSDQDKLLTRQLVLAATTVNIKVIDHLIISRDRCLSFRKEGLL